MRAAIGWLRGATVVLAVLLVNRRSASAQDPESGDDPDHHHAPLHFSHPLIGESISPDTKLRLDYFFSALEGDSVQHHTLRLEGEYAFGPGFSIEVNLPYTVARQSGQAERANAGNAELAFKFANFALASEGLVLGYGAELGLPTGNDAKGIGSDHVLRAQPFARVGYMHGGLEVTAFAGVEFQMNGRDSDSLETVVAQTVSVLYHFMPRLQGLLELDGETPFGGDPLVSVSPGLKLRPFGRSSLLFGAPGPLGSFTGRRGVFGRKPRSGLRPVVRCDRRTGAGAGFPGWSEPGSRAAGAVLRVAHPGRLRHLREPQAPSDGDGRDGRNAAPDADESPLAAAVGSSRAPPGLRRFGVGRRSRWPRR